MNRAPFSPPACQPALTGHWLNLIQLLFNAMTGGLADPGIRAYHLNGTT
jgi:hypothetical protein